MNEKRKQFGEDLVQQRTQMGVSLEAMSRATKIRKPVLEALEAGRFEELPPEVFVIGFLQAYANHLGIDPAQLVARYKRLVETPLTLEKQQEEAKRAIPAAPRGKSGTSLYLGIAVLLLLLGAIAYLVWAWNTGLWPFQDIFRPSTAQEEPSGQPNPAHKPPVTPPQDQTNAPANEIPPAPVRPANVPGANNEVVPPSVTPAANQAANAAAVPPAAPSNTTPAVPAANTAATQPPAPTGPLPNGDLVIVCDKRCWIEMFADGKRQLYREVTPGERLVYSGKAFRFNVGNPKGIQIIFHGQAVELPDTGSRSLKNFLLPHTGGPPQ